MKSRFCIDLRHISSLGTDLTSLIDPDISGMGCWAHDQPMAAISRSDLGGEMVRRTEGTILTWTRWSTDRLRLKAGGVGRKNEKARKVRVRNGKRK